MSERENMDRLREIAALSDEEKSYRAMVAVLDVVASGRQTLSRAAAAVARDQLAALRARAERAEAERFEARELLEESTRYWRGEVSRLCSALVGIRRAADARRSENDGERHQYYYHTADAALDGKLQGGERNAGDYEAWRRFEKAIDAEARRLCRQHCIDEPCNCGAARDRDWRRDAINSLRRALQGGDKP